MSMGFIQSTPRGTSAYATLAFGFRRFPSCLTVPPTSLRPAWGIVQRNMDWDLGHKTGTSTNCLHFATHWKQRRETESTNGLYCFLCHDLKCHSLNMCFSAGLDKISGIQAWFLVTFWLCRTTKKERNLQKGGQDGVHFSSDDGDNEGTSPKSARFVEPREDASCWVFLSQRWGVGGGADKSLQKDLTCPEGHSELCRTPL